MLGNARIAGVELGGTKTILVLSEGKEILERLTIPTTTPGDTLAAVRRQLAIWSESGALQAVGIASFGPLQLDRQATTFGHMLETPKPGWRGADISGGVTEGLACPWRLDTDVNGAALAEYHWGAGEGAATLCYVTVGTGLGGGLLAGGRLLHGAMHPEIGHIRIRRVPGDTFPGVCPMHGDCIEGLVSGPALGARFGRPIQDVRDDDPLWGNVAADLSELAATLLLAVSPQRLLFGGGVISARPFLLPMMRKDALESLSGYLPFFNAQSAEEVISLPALGQDAGPMGALALALRAIDAI
jgi:fructokinase